MSQTIERPTTTSEQAPRLPRQQEPRKPSLLGDVGDELAVGAVGHSEARPRRTFRLSPFVRLRITAVLVTLFALAIMVQLFSLQIQDRYNSKEFGTELRVWESPIPATRGLIRDANGLLLASNIYVYNVYAAPQGLTERQSAKVASILSPLLPNVPAAKIKEAVTYTDSKHINNLIAAAVDAPTADRIRAAQLPGISLEAKTRRTYPNNSFLSQLIGFANFEGTGAYGLENYYNKELAGTPGTQMAEHDREGNPIVLGQIQLKPPVDGADLTLTIDSSIQFMVERELKKGMEKHGAEKAMAIVADPKTGAILAWASYPNFDPNHFYETDAKLFRDPNVSDMYEPGSTFKILTAAIGIDTKAVTPESAADLPGCVIKYGKTICNYNSVGYKHQTVVDTLEHSSNVGAMWIAEKFGPDKYYDYLNKFGIGSLTGIDLHDEASGMFRTKQNKDWSPLDFLTNSFGQSVAVTPIQLVQAVSAVANGGKLMKPYVVARVTRGDQVLSETQPTVVRQVISPETAKTTTDMLVSAVRLGETRLADVKGYRIAGKTGTATLYDSNLTIGSTIAYAPADNPRFIILVRYDKTKDTPWGSNTAAPVVQTIAENLFAYYKIPPTEPVK
jgi:cell division protein FtsI (penicillin-binding protein 3)